MQVIRLRFGDCFEKLKEIPEGTIGATVTDPPYGLEFMGKNWDKLTLEGTASGKQTEHWGEFDNPFARRATPRFKGKTLGEATSLMNEMQEWHKGWLAQVYRVLRPGGVIKVFSATRTYHRLAKALEEVGFQLLREESLESWMYGSGFPKSLNLHTKALELDPELAAALEGYGTALKPAWEPFLVARK